MRTALFATTMLALATLPALAAANAYHYECGYSDASLDRTVAGTRVYADVWADQCVGASAGFARQNIRCLGDDIHASDFVSGLPADLHVLVLYPGCTVGGIVQLA